MQPFIGSEVNELSSKRQRVGHCQQQQEAVKTHTRIVMNLDNKSASSQHHCCFLWKCTAHTGWCPTLFWKIDGLMFIRARESYQNELPVIWTALKALFHLILEHNFNCVFLPFTFSALQLTFYNARTLFLCNLSISSPGHIVFPLMFFSLFIGFSLIAYWT